MLSPYCQCLSLQSVRLRFGAGEASIPVRTRFRCPQVPVLAFPFSFCLISSGLKNSGIFYLLKVRDEGTLRSHTSQNQRDPGLAQPSGFPEMETEAQLVWGKARSRTLVQLNSKCQKDVSLYHHGDIRAGWSYVLILKMKSV